MFYLERDAEGYLRPNKAYYELERKVFGKIRQHGWSKRFPKPGIIFNKQKHR